RCDHPVMFPPLSIHGRILLANSNQLYFNNLVKTPCHKTSCRCPHRLHLTSQCSHSCAHLNIKTLKDKDLEFANSIPREYAERGLKKVSRPWTRRPIASVPAPRRLLARLRRRARPSLADTPLG